MSSVTQSKYTADELLELPDGEKYELVNGQLEERTMSAESSVVAARLLSRINSFVEEGQTGVVCGADCSFQCFNVPDDPERVRYPDLAFLPSGRLTREQFERGHVPIAPDLAVEVISPNDLSWKVNGKVEEWLSAGVKLVWVIDPASRLAVVHRPDGSDSRLHENDVLDGEDVLPGFQCPVAELFPDVTVFKAV